MGLRQTEWTKFEEEHPDLLFFIYKNTGENIPRSLPPDIISYFETLTFKGKPNDLSKEHVDWDIIDNVASWTQKPKTDEAAYVYDDYDFFQRQAPQKSGIEIIRQRRSALAYDGKTPITKEQFLSILDKTIPRNHCAPFDLELGRTSIHLLLFVHRVSDLEPGLYFLIRNEKDFEEIKGKTHHDFLWERIKGAPDKLFIYFLKRGDFHNRAKTVSCQQEIAGDGVFSLGMIAKFRENVEKAPYLYHHLFWETGMIGQVLYLEAEAHSVRGTGIGCFYDDMVHEILGFTENSFQSLYHFTVGAAVEDKRIATLPSYYHLNA
ncbi:MAG: SagB/ThcOx family dehydrogenase [Candidatus Scalinduaceae bacterium]